jgi:hypothetical protein
VCGFSILAGHRCFDGQEIKKIRHTEFARLFPGTISEKILLKTLVGMIKETPGWFKFKW